MQTSSSVRRFRAVVASVVLLVGVDAIHSKAQSNALAGRWVSPEPDKGVVITLSIGSANTLIIPGTGPSGRTEALTLTIRNLRTSQQGATFTVDLPDNEGAVDFEFRITSAGAGTLGVVMIDGEPPDDDFPVWTLRRTPDR